MIAKVIDNNRYVLIDTLDELCASYKDISIATGYWDLPGTGLLLRRLKEFKKVRLLIGQEPLLPRYRTHKPEIDFPDKDIFEDLERLEQDVKYTHLTAEIKEMIDSGKLEVRVYRKTFFHAKAYIFGNYLSNENVAIVGSSNFTRAGLTGNTELNGTETDGRLIRSVPQTSTQEEGHLHWFDSFWDEADEWSGEFSHILSTSPVGDQMFSSYEMYIATLYRIFKDELSEDETVNKERSLFEFQRRNANLLLKKLKRHGLAMLSDSVGLGKTITAGSIIEHYLNDPSGRQRVEVIVPAKLSSQWETELSQHYGIHEVSIVSLQNEDRILQRRRIDVDAEVKLFVIDEAHNLRNESGSRYKQLFEWLANNPNSHVLMLTATPINNQLSDFANQIQLAAKGRRGTFKVMYAPAGSKEPPRSRDFDEVIRSLDSNIKARAKQGKEINFAEVRKNLRPVLSHFMVRATRHGIEKVYGGLKDQNGTISHFPESKVDTLPYDFTQAQARNILNIIKTNSSKLPVEKIFSYSLEDLLESTQRSIHPLKNLTKNDTPFDRLSDTQSFDLIYHLLLCLGLPIYRDMLYMHRFYDKDPEQLKQFRLNKEDGFRLRSQMSIHNILRINYLKRLESSPSALLSSLYRYRERLKSFSFMVDQGKLFRIKDLDQIDKFEGYDNVSIPEEAEGNVVEISSQSHNIEGLKEDIALDFKLLDLIEECVHVLSDNDKKLDAFAAHLTKLQHTQPAGKKVLVFSFYADTVEYLKKTLPAMTGGAINQQNTGFVSGKTKNFVDDYTRRFAPKAKNYELTAIDTELDYLISTDVLSEGQNLQDCGMLINYDLHWNPVRMIQRNGRINRLGSEFSEVFIWNMTPAHELEEYLKLVRRLNQKIDLIKNSVGTDQPIMGGDAQPIEFLDAASDDTTVEKTLAAIRGDKRVISELEEEADFSLGEDSFIADLRKFDLEADEDTKYRVYKKIPRGKWGLLPLAASNNTKAPNALSLVNFDVEKGEELIGDHTRFFSINTTDYSLSAFDQLEALSLLKTSPDDNQHHKDTISFDKKILAENLKSYGAMQAMSEYHSAGSNQPKPAQQKVLEYLLTNLQVDINPIYDAISSGKNRVYEKDLNNAIRKAGDKIKENIPLVDADVIAIESAAEKLNVSDVSDHLLTNMEIIYNYAKR